MKEKIETLENELKEVQEKIFNLNKKRRKLQYIINLLNDDTI